MAHADPLPVTEVHFWQVHVTIHTLKSESMALWNKKKRSVTEYVQLCTKYFYKIQYNNDTYYRNSE